MIGIIVMEVQKDFCITIMQVNIDIRILENLITLGILEVNMQVKSILNFHLIVSMDRLLVEI